MNEGGAGPAPGSPAAPPQTVPPPVSLADPAANPAAPAAPPQQAAPPPVSPADPAANPAAPAAPPQAAPPPVSRVTPAYPAANPAAPQQAAPPPVSPADPAANPAAPAAPPQVAPPPVSCVTPTEPAASPAAPAATPDATGGDSSGPSAAATTPPTPPAAPHSTQDDNTGTAGVAPASAAPAAAAPAAAPAAVRAPVGAATDHTPTQLNMSSTARSIERASRGRQCLGPKGVELTGSGQLPVLDTYLSDLSERKKQPSAVTQYLADSLYKHHAPPNLPQRLQSFIVGPSARQPDLYSPQTLHPRPASASSSLATLPRLQGASSAYDHVKPRIWSAHTTPQTTPPQSQHTQLLHGSESPPRHAAPRPASSYATTPPGLSTSSTTATLGNISSLIGALGGQSTGSPQTTPPMHAQLPHLAGKGPQHPHPHVQQHQGQNPAAWQQQGSPRRSRRSSHRPRAGDPLSKLVAAELQQQGEVLRSKPQAAAAQSAGAAAVVPGSPQRGALHGKLPALQHTHAQAATPTNIGPSHLSYGPPLAASLPQHTPHQPPSPTRHPPHKPPPLQLSSTLSTTNGEAPSPGPSPGLQANKQKQAADLKVARFVGDVARVMGRLQTSTGVPKDLDGRSIGTASPEVLARARQRQSAAAASVARQQALRVPLISTVKLPAGLQGAASATGKSGGAQMLHDLYERQGHTKSHMRKMLDQLPQLSRLEEPLLQALADSFVPFSYAPNSLMLAQDVTCNEVLVVLSGQVFVQPRESKVHYAGTPQPSRPVRLQPGTVLGISHMLQRLPVPNDVRSDPHFECHVATMKWEDYERQLCSWAAGKVLQHFPGMQFSVEAQLRAAISQHSMHMHRDAGAALCTEGSGADHLMLLVQGQTLLAKQLQENDIVTEGQLVQHLRTTLGPTQDKIALQPGTPSRGLKKKASGRSKAFQAALLRRQAMLVSSGGTPKGDTPKGSASKAFETVVEGTEGEEGAKSAPEDASPPPPSNTHGVQPREEGGNHQGGHGGAGGHTSSSEVGMQEQQQQQQQQADAWETLQHDSDHPGSAHPADQPTLAPLSPSPRPSSKSGTPPLPPQPLPTSPPPTTSPPTTTPPTTTPPSTAPQDPTQPQHPIPSLRLKLGGSSFSASSPAHHPYPNGAASGSGSGASSGAVARGASQRAHRTGSGSRSDSNNNNNNKSEKWGASPRGAAQQSASPRHTHAHAHAQARASSSGMQPSSGASGNLGGDLRASSAPGLSNAPLPPTLPHDAAAPEQQQQQQPQPSAQRARAGSVDGTQAQHALHDSVDAGAQGAAPAVGTPSGGGGVGGEAEGTVRSHTEGGAVRSHTEVPSHERGGSPLRSEGARTGEAAHAVTAKGAQEEGEGRRDGGGSRGHKMEDAKSVAGKQSAASRAASVMVSHGSQNEEESSEAGAAVPEGLRGVPLLNALATMMKTHHQQVEAVFSQPVFMGMEALRASPEERVHRNTILSLQNTEVILIPRSALAAILPESAISQLVKRMRAQAHNIATMAAGPPQGSVVERWPDNADAMREFLQTKPGARPVWQAENLADGFSSVRALAELPWQARLRLFQGLKHMVVQQSDPAFSLAIPTLEEVLRPVPGREFEFVAALKAEQEGGVGAADEGDPDVAASRKSCAQDDGEDEGERGMGSTDGGARSSQDGQAESEAADKSRVMRTTPSVALRGIIERVAQAEAAMARVGKPAIKEGSAEGSQGSPADAEAGAPPHSQEGASQEEAQTHGSERAADMESARSGVGWDAELERRRSVTAPAHTAERTSPGSHEKREAGGSAFSGGVAQGEGGAGELDSGAGLVHDLSSHNSGESEIEATLLRSMSTVGAVMGEEGSRAQGRRMRSPDSALNRLRAAAEAAELARTQAEEGEGGPERCWVSMDGLPRHSGGWELHPGQHHPHQYHPDQQHPHHQLPAGARVSVSLDGRPSVWGVSEAESYQYAGHSGSDGSGSPVPVAHSAQGRGDLSEGQAVHLGMVAGLQQPARVADTPDTDKLGSLASWDGSIGHHGMPLPHSGPCTPLSQSAMAAEADPFPAPYKPYDMDRKLSGVSQSAPASKQGRPPLPKTGSGAGLSMPAGPAPPARRGEAPTAPSKAPQRAPAPTKRAAAPQPDSQRTTPQPAPNPGPHPSHPSTTRTHVPARTPAVTLAPSPPPGPHSHSPQGWSHSQPQGGASKLSPSIARRRVIVLEPAPDQKDDQQYIIIGGSVTIQAQQLPSLTEATPLASQASSRTLNAEGELRRRRSIRQPGHPAVLLAELGMGDAFSARTATDLLTAHVAAAVAASEADYAAADEEGAQGSSGSGGGSKAPHSTAGTHGGGRAAHAGRANSMSSRGHKHAVKGKEPGAQAQPLPLPPGPCQVVAVVTSPAVELLAMNAALFWLVVGGAGRAMSKLDVEDVLKKVEPTWMGELWQSSKVSALDAGSPRARAKRKAQQAEEAATNDDNKAEGSSGEEGQGRLSLQQVAKDLADFCRVEEHKQGTELLRRGEAAACVFVVANGGCVLRGGFVGLVPEAAGQAVVMMDLLKVKAGDTVGELSLLANRPLWYSMVVSSATARVVSVDLKAFRNYVSQRMSPGTLERMLHRVAERDLRLYATAIHTQALLIQQGKMVLEMFVPSMRMLLKQILLLGPIGANGVQGAALETMEAMAQGKHAPKKKRSSEDTKASVHHASSGGRGDEEGGLVAAAKEVGPVVVENAAAANQLVEDLARPTAVTAMPAELVGVAHWQRIQRQKDAYLSSITQGSHVLQHSSFQLSSLLHATQTPFGSHGYDLDWLAQEASHEGWSSRIQPQGGTLGGPDHVVHICMPTASLPGDDPYMIRPLHEPRPSHRVEHKTGPRAISGEDLERRWDVAADQAPTSVLSADEVMRLIRARVHLKPSNLSAALARSTRTRSDDGASTDDEGEGSTAGCVRAQAQPASQRFWGEGDAGFWDDTRSVGDRSVGAVISTEGTGHVLGLRDADLKRMGYYGGLDAKERGSGVRASVSGGLRVSVGGGSGQATARRASMSIARQSDFGDAGTPKSGDQRRRMSFAGGLGGLGGTSKRASVVDPSREQGDGHKSFQHRSQARAAHRAAARGRGRTGRVLQRRLTEWAWDDSPDALAELTARKPGDSSYESSSSSSSEFDPVVAARRMEDARLLEIQFSVLGQGKRGTEHSTSRAQRASAGSPARDSRRTRRLSIALTDASEDEGQRGGDASTAAIADSPAAAADRGAAAGPDHVVPDPQKQQGATKAVGVQEPPAPLAAEDSQLSQASSYQRPGSFSPQGRRSLRRNRSAVSFAVDSCKGPLPAHFQRALSPTQQPQEPLEAVPESRPESRELAGQALAQERPPWSPEEGSIPEAILEALASQPPEPGAPFFRHTYSMGQAAIKAAEQMFPPEGHDRREEPEGSDKGGRSSQAPEDEHFGPAELTPSQPSPSTVSESSSAGHVSQHTRGKAPGPAPGRDDSGTDLQERGFWVRDSLHDPSGITNPSMSLLMGEAVAKALPHPQTSSRTGVLGRAPAMAARTLPPPSLQSEPSTSSFASSSSPAFASVGPRLQGEPANVNVHVRLPPPRDSLRPPKMRGLPGSDGDSSEEEGGKPRAPDPQKQLLLELWREHRQVEAEVKEEERKRAIKSAFEIASPRKPRAGDAAPQAPTAEDLSGWDAEAEKRKSAAKRLEELKALLQYAAQPGRLKVVEAPQQRVRQPKPTPKPAPPKPAPPKLAPLKDAPPLSPPGLGGHTKAGAAQHGGSPSRAAPLLANARLGGGPKPETPQPQQQQQGSRSLADEGGAAATAQGSSGAHAGTATSAQLAALPPFSSNMLAKNRERQRAAAARRARGPLPVQGRPTTPLGRADPHGFSPHLHQQQLRQQQHFLQEEAQGWWDASAHGAHAPSPPACALPDQPGSLAAGTSMGMQGAQQGAVPAHSLGGGIDGGGSSISLVGGIDGGGGRSEGLGAAEEHVRGPGGASMEQRKLEIDARLLQEEDCAYVTVQVPPRTRITPEVDLSSHKRPHLQQEQQPTQQPFKHTRHEPHMHMRAMMKKVSGPSGKGDDTDAEQPGYVPTFLRSKRQSLAPENLSRVKIDHEQWVVPQFSSTVGFEYGLFDQNNEITYFD